jgi:hypothetical protein
LRGHTNLLDWKSPYELWHNHPYDFKHLPLLPFGCHVLAHVPTSLQTKLSNNAISTYYVGSSPTHPYCIQLFDRSTKHVIHRRTFKVLDATSTTSQQPILHSFLDAFSTETNTTLDSNFLSLHTQEIETIPISPTIDQQNSDSLQPIFTTPPIMSSNQIPTNLRRSTRTSGRPVINYTIPDENNIPFQSTNSIPTPPVYPPISISPTTEPNDLLSDDITNTFLIDLFNNAPIDSQSKFVNFIQTVNFHDPKHKTINSNIKSTFIPKSVSQFHRTDNPSAWHTALLAELKSLQDSSTFCSSPIPSDIDTKLIVPSQLLFDIRYNPDGSIKNTNAASLPGATYNLGTLSVHSMPILPPTNLST